MIILSDCAYHLCGHGPYCPPESRRKRQTKKFKLGLKYMYYHVRYIVRLYECTSRIFKNFYLRCFVLFCKIFWTLPGRHQPKVSTPSPSPHSTQEIYSGLDPMDLKIYTLAKNPRLWLNSCKNLWIFAELSFMTSTSAKDRCRGPCYLVFQLRMGIYAFVIYIVWCYI